MSDEPTGPIPDVPKLDRWGSLIKPLSDLAVTFGRDRLSLTLVACLALAAVLSGRDPIPTLSFASMFIVGMPLFAIPQIAD